MRRFLGLGSARDGSRERHDRAHGQVIYGPYRPPERHKRQRRARTGSEPRTARSDLELRRLLSRIFGVLFVLGAAAFAVLAARATPGAAPNRDTFVFFAALCAAFAVIAAVDLLVVTRRLAARRRNPGPPERPRRP